MRELQPAKKPKNALYLKPMTTEPNENWTLPTRKLSDWVGWRLKRKAEQQGENCFDDGNEAKLSGQEEPEKKYSTGPVFHFGF